VCGARTQRSRGGQVGGPRGVAAFPRAQGLGHHATRRSPEPARLPPLQGSGAAASVGQARRPSAQGQGHACALGCRVGEVPRSQQGPGRRGGEGTTGPNIGLQPTPTASAPASLRLLARLRPGVRAGAAGIGGLRVVQRSPQCLFSRPDVSTRYARRGADAPHAVLPQAGPPNACGGACRWPCAPDSPLGPAVPVRRRGGCPIPPGSAHWISTDRLRGLSSASPSWSVQGPPVHRGAAPQCGLHACRLCPHVARRAAGDRRTGVAWRAMAPDRVQGRNLEVCVPV